MMSFKENDEVIIKALKKRGIVVSTSRQVYRVSVGSLLIDCKEADLLRAEPKKPKNPAGSGAVRTPSPASGTLSLDLHGRTTSETAPLVEDFISRACLENSEKVEIVHGLGSGKLQNTVWKTLSSLTVVRHFKLDETNPGKTVAYL